MGANTENAGRGGLIGAVISLLPLLLIGLLGLGIFLYGATNVFPQWRTYEQLSSQVETNRQSADALDEQGSSLEMLQSRLDSASADLAQSAALLLTASQADDLLNRLYAYAQDSGVAITRLEAQTPTPVPATSDYETRVFRLQVEGEVAGLLNFVVRLREASLASVGLDNLTLSEAGDGSVLLLDLTLYTSPYASGEALNGLPTEPPAMPTSNTPDATPIPSILAADISTPDTTGIEQAACPDAPPTLFHIGDTAVVDFNVAGALRILARANGAIDTLTQAYDNDVLQILSGPVCGKWQEANVWYWYVDLKGVEGWAAEAAPGDRWLCTTSNPECA